MVSSQAVQARLSRPRFEVQWVGGPDRRDSRSVVGSGSVLVLTAAFVVGAMVDNADVVVDLDHEATVAAWIMSITARRAIDDFMVT